MNRLSKRLLATAAGLAACSAVVTGCGSGQISQVASQHSAVNGTAANVKDIALRNVHLLADQTGDFLQPGKAVPLVFVAANDSVDTNDRLLSITSDVGTVALAGDATIAAGKALVIAARGQAEALSTAVPATAEVTLTKPITNGLSYPFTFTFEKAGSATVAVPVSAGEAERR